MFKCGKIVLPKHYTNQSVDTTPPWSWRGCCEQILGFHVCSFNAFYCTFRLAFLANNQLTPIYQVFQVAMQETVGQNCQIRDSLICLPCSIHTTYPFVIDAAQFKQNVLCATTQTQTVVDRAATSMGCWHAVPLESVSWGGWWMTFRLWGQIWNV